MRFLREEKSLSLFMVCKDIKQIEVCDDIAFIDAEEKIIDELFNNEKYFDELKAFFKNLNLSIKPKKEKKILTPEEKLNNLLGGNLTVE